MTASREPLFLARRSYRRRRLMDAARMLPWLGLVLFLFPVLGGGEGASGTAPVGLYLFGVWAALIAVAGLVSRRLVREDEAGRDAAGRDEA